MGGVSTYKPRRAKCTECGNGMIKKHSCQKYCPSCRKIVRARQKYASCVRTGWNKNPGVGMGGCKPHHATCDECGKGMLKKSPARKYHPACWEIVNARLKIESAIRTGKTQKPGVGAGGNRRWGEDHGKWVGGGKNWQVYTFRGTECERCGDGGQMHLHHRDRDRSNWKKGNLETLCVPCHKEEHRDDGGVMYAAA